MSTKFKVDPLTGKMQTDGYDTPLQEHARKVTGAEDLQRARRELRDMIGGNTQFHEDPLAKPGPVAGADEPGIELDTGEFVPAAKISARQVGFNPLLATSYGFVSEKFLGIDVRYVKPDATAVVDHYRQVYSRMWERCAELEEKARNDVRALAVEAGFVRDAAGKLFAINQNAYTEVPVDEMLIKFATLVLLRRAHIGVDPGAPGGDASVSWRYSK